MSSPTRSAPVIIVLRHPDSIHRPRVTVEPNPDSDPDVCIRKLDQCRSALPVMACLERRDQLTTCYDRLAACLNRLSPAAVHPDPSARALPG